jgi:large subunit ribosomal protein L27e
MPTRYTLELEGLKNVVTNETFTEVSHREEAKKTVKKALEERYVSGKNRWFFTPLRTYNRDGGSRRGGLEMVLTAGTGF